VTVAHARILLRTELLKNLLFGMIQESYIPNLVKIVHSRRTTVTGLNMQVNIQA